jgi:uncharacterized oxidoreductase
LKETSIKVFELMPPICDTDLGKDASDDAPRPSYLKGIPPSQFAKDALTAIENDQYEFASGEAKQLRDGSRHDFEATFQALNNQ